jgi:hypothetical protein
MNEMHLFDIESFLFCPSNAIICSKVNVTEGVPTTRWGHAAASYNGNLYILGGRNEHDIIDLHEFSIKDMQWRNIEIGGAIPKPRRRHSAVFISGSLVMFGGFDSNFFNDMHVLDF